MIKSIKAPDNWLELLPDSKKKIIIAFDALQIEGGITPEELSKKIDITRRHASRIIYLLKESGARIIHPDRLKPHYQLISPKDLIDLDFSQFNF